MVFILCVSAHNAARRRAEAEVLRPWHPAPHCRVISNPFNHRCDSNFICHVVLEGFLCSAELVLYATKAGLNSEILLQHE